MNGQGKSWCWKSKRQWRQAYVFLEGEGNLYPLFCIILNTNWSSIKYFPTYKVCKHIYFMVPKPFEKHIFSCRLLKRCRVTSIYLVQNISDIKGLKWKFEFWVVLCFLPSKISFKIHILKNATDQTPANPQQFYSLLEMC